jgi:hypothetical protein
MHVVARCRHKPTAIASRARLCGRTSTPQKADGVPNTWDSIQKGAGPCSSTMGRKWQERGMQHILHTTRARKQSKDGDHGDVAPAFRGVTTTARASIQAPCHSYLAHMYLESSNFRIRLAFGHKTIRHPRFPAAEFDP